MEVLVQNPTLADKFPAHLRATDMPRPRHRTQSRRLLPRLETRPKL